MIPKTYSTEFPVLLPANTKVTISRQHIMGLLNEAVSVMPHVMEIFQTLLLASMLIFMTIFVLDITYHITQYFKIVIYNPSAEEVVTGKGAIIFTRRGRLFGIAGHQFFVGPLRKIPNL